MDDYVVYVGSYTRVDPIGIYVFDVVGENELALKSTVEIPNASFICLSNDEKYLYTSCDTGVAAYSIKADGNLVFLNKGMVNGLRPDYLSIDKTGRFLAAAGYHDGKLTILRLHENGSIGPVKSEEFMEGIGGIDRRHHRCHVSCAIFTPDNKYVLAVNIGANQVRIYSFNEKTGAIKFKDLIRCELDSGPKHMIFSKNGKCAYLIQEVTGVITVYSYDGNGNFEKIQSVRSFEEQGSGSDNFCESLRISEDGTKLYVTNSGRNYVTIFDILETGKLKQFCSLPISGEYPVDVLISADNIHFISLNQDSDEMLGFVVDSKRRCFYRKGRPMKLVAPTRILKHKL